MNRALQIRCIIALFLAAVLPLEAGQCLLLRALRVAGSVAIAASAHAAETEHACCPESRANREPAAPAAGDCCSYTPMLASAATFEPVLRDPASPGIGPVVLPSGVDIRPAIATAREFPHVDKTRAPSDPGILRRSPRGPPPAA